MHTGQLHYYEKCKIRNVAYADKMEYLSFDVESKNGAHLNTISVCTVSYTHLDVYKRQG